MSYTFYLFARPSFISGMASILDIGGTNLNYNISRTPEEADTLALQSDWMTVGEDIRNSINHHESILRKVEK